MDWLIENKDWFFSGVGIFILTSFFALLRWLFRSGKITKYGSVVFSGREKWAWNEPNITREVFYPRPFDSNPNLNVVFPRKENSKVILKRDGGWHNYGLHPPKPVFEIIEQRADGFLLKVDSIGYYKPIFKWKAKGVIAKNR